MTRFLLTGLFSLATLAGIGGMAAVSAKEPQYPGPYPGQVYRDDLRHGDHGYFRRYAVYYKTCHTDPWRYYGSFASHWEAHRAENYLERRGYNARVEHRDHRNHRGPWER